MTPWFIAPGIPGVRRDLDIFEFTIFEPGDFEYSVAVCRYGMFRVTTRFYGCIQTTIQLCLVGMRSITLRPLPMSIPHQPAESEVLG
jgi:hypothetical protein